jgi:alpha-L-rhamnosidase
VKVRVTGDDGLQSEWAELTVEAALLERSDWVGSLIGGPDHRLNTPKRPFRLRKSFSCQTAGSARLYATAHGIYQVEINGRIIGDELLTPGWQSYKHRLHYQTYDVTQYIMEGENVIGAHVAEGWYAGRLGRPGTSNIWGNRLGFLAQLEVDGKNICCTDTTWKSVESPLLAAEIYNGEIFDSNLDDPSWSTTASAKPATGRVDELPFPSAKLISPDVAPVRRIMEIAPKSIIRTPSGKTVLDFGQNIVGWLRVLVDIPGKQGEKAVIRHAEVLEHGELGTRPLRTARAETAIQLGGRTRGYEPKFSWYGFRCVLHPLCSLH